MSRSGKPRRVEQRLAEVEDFYVKGIEAAIEARTGPRSDVLTQGSNRDGVTFPEAPRWFLKEADVSMVDGPVTADELVPLCFHRSATPIDTVRYFDVQALIDADYLVLATPSRSNPQHVSVVAPRPLDPMTHRQWWESAERVTLEQIATRTLEERP